MSAAGLPRQSILVVDDDSSITDMLGMLLEREGRTVIVCSDVESAELMLARHLVTHVLSDVQFSGPFGFEGLHFLSRIRALRPSCRIVLMTGLVNELLERVATSCGASAVLKKPFDVSDVENVLRLHADGEGAYELVAVPTLDEVLRRGLITTAFQPIVTFDGSVFGYEALTRVQGPWGGGGIAELFDYAAKLGRLADLNLAALETALTRARDLPADTKLFLNVDPATFDRPELVGVLRRTASGNGFALARLVIEITERSGFADDDAALRVFDELRAEGVCFAFDDHGSEYSHLALIERIGPSFIKISNTFGTAFNEDSMRMRVVRHIVALARDFDCRTILEGIETESTARAAAACGIDLAQGYYFGRPQAASHWMEATLAAA